MEFVEINLHLFGKPAWEFPNGMNPKTIKAKGDELKARLDEIADELKKLTDNGWNYNSTLYGLTLNKNISKSEAKKELKRLNINAEVILLEDED